MKAMSKTRKQTLAILSTLALIFSFPGSIVFAEDVANMNRENVDVFLPVENVEISGIEKDETIVQEEREGSEDVDGSEDASAEQDVEGMEETNESAVQMENKSDMNDEEADNEKSLESLPEEKDCHSQDGDSEESEKACEDAEQMVEVSTDSADLEESAGEEENQAKGDEDFQEEINSINVSNSNEFSGENIIDASSETGDNSSSKDISTGDALSEINQVNDINSNIYGSNYLELIINIFGNYGADVNLFGEFALLLQDAELSEPQETAVNNSNEIELENDLSASADTGANSADGNGKISTGSANAEVNLVNLINRNLVGDNWLFSVINVFGDWNGDLVAFSPEAFLVPPAKTYQEMNVVNDNSANIENYSKTSANTGSNEISGKGDVESGNAEARSDTYNQVNTNITKDNWFFLTINNMGVWSGKIFNWNGSGDESRNVYSFDLESEGEAEAGGSLTVFNANRADVNNVSFATADTGENSVDGNGKISTGNASAFSRIVNIVNTNIVGNNWFFGIVNIFGSWKGDLIFSEPGYVKPVVKNETTAKANKKRSKLKVKIKEDGGTFSVYVKNSGETDLYNTELRNHFYDSNDNKIAEFAYSIGKIKRGREYLIQFDAQVEGAAGSFFRSMAYAVAIDQYGDGVKSEKNYERFIPSFLGEFGQRELPHGYLKRGSELSGEMLMGTRGSGYGTLWDYLRGFAVAHDDFFAGQALWNETDHGEERIWHTFYLDTCQYQGMIFSKRQLDKVIADSFSGNPGYIQSLTESNLTNKKFFCGLLS